MEKWRAHYKDKNYDMDVEIINFGCNDSLLVYPDTIRYRCFQLEVNDDIYPWDAG